MKNPDIGIKSMSKGVDLIVIGAEEWWEAKGIRPRGASLARAFGASDKVEKVLLINCPRSLPGRIKSLLYGERQIEAIYPVMFKKSGFSVMQVSPKMVMINTTVLMPESAGFFAGISRKMLTKRLCALIKDLGFEDNILWVLNPRIIDIAKAIPSRIKIFDTIDNLLAHPQAQKFYRKIKKAYEWVESNADLICIISDKQKTMFSDTLKLCLLPNAIGSEFLQAVRTKPADIGAIRHPMIIYVGVLQERIDVALMEGVAKLLPNHQFVFIGPDVAPRYFKTIRQISNIHFIGPRNYDSIPSYISCADACMIPHKVDSLTNFMDPLKIYEYLACGKPIISTPVAGTENFKKYIHIADNSEAFAAAIKKALSENNVSLEKERKTQALLHTWDTRVEVAMGKIGEILDHEQAKNE